MGMGMRRCATGVPRRCEEVSVTGIMCFCEYAIAPAVGMYTSTYKIQKRDLSSAYTQFSRVPIATDSPVPRSPSSGNTNQTGVGNIREGIRHAPLSGTAWYTTAPTVSHSCSHSSHCTIRYGKAPFCRSNAVHPGARQYSAKSMRQWGDVHLWPHSLHSKRPRPCRSFSCGLCFLVVAGSAFSGVAACSGVATPLPLPRPPPLPPPLPPPRPMPLPPRPPPSPPPLIWDCPFRLGRAAFASRGTFSAPSEFLAVSSCLCPTVT